MDNRLALTFKKDRIADNHFSDFGLKDKAYYRTKIGRKSTEDDESFHIQIEIRLVIRYPSSYVYRTRSLPREGMHASASSKQSGPHRFHRVLLHARQTTQSDLAQRQNLELGLHLMKYEIHSMPLSNNEFTTHSSVPTACQTSCYKTLELRSMSENSGRASDTTMG